MNPPIASPVNSIVQPFQAIVEVLANGQVTAWVAEFQDLKVIAADSSACAKGDRATAIIELEKVLKKRLESIECVMIEVDSFAYAKGDQETQSIDTLPSVPMNDQYFKELMATFRADRELDDDNPAYTMNW
jgi:uncharacterized surface protein with fasciclin (FAS1) repeats